MLSDAVEHGRSPHISGVAATSNKRGLVFAAVALLAFIACVACFAVGQVHAGVSAASVTLLVSGVALSWLSSESRRLRDSQAIGTRSHTAH